MRRASRLFQIVQLLQRRRVTTAEWLAQELEVSVRTIYRDMQELLVSGVPIQGEAGVGYMLPQYFTLPPVTFDHEELQALLLGMRMVKSWADPGLANAASSALRKISAVLPEGLQEQLAQNTIHAPDHVIPDAANAWMMELRQAIKEKRKAHICYLKREEETPTERVLWPLALFFWGRTWSISGWCELREGFRNFRLDRIASLTLEGPYPDEPGKTLDDLKASIEARYHKEAWSDHLTFGT